jgi:hypothetical protein
MLHWKELVRQSDWELAAHDIAAVNLACAEGLPGAPTPDQISACLQWLDLRAQQVRQYTASRLFQLHADPGQYDHSEGKFRCVCMSRLLGHLGLRYNPAKIPEEAVFETADTFIHGAILGQGGTCATLPVVYAAVGRRLGYPLKIVSTWEHLFLRWDQPGGERFNFEVNATGSNSLPDDYYRSWPRPITPEQEREGLLLLSETPRMELSGFLAQRGYSWLELGKRRLAMESFLWALEVAPQNVGLERRASRTLRDWQDEMWAATPEPGWRGLQVRLPEQRRYPAVPKDMEDWSIYYEVVEDLLRCPDFNERRRRAGGLPARIVVFVNKRVALGETAVYDPTVGRWLMEDPLGFDAGDYNLERYVGNAPTDGTDPSGLEVIAQGDDSPNGWPQQVVRYLRKLGLTKASAGRMPSGDYLIDVYGHTADQWDTAIKTASKDGTNGEFWATWVTRIREANTLNNHLYLYAGGALKPFSKPIEGDDGQFVWWWNNERNFGTQFSAAVIKEKRDNLPAERFDEGLFWDNVEKLAPGLKKWFVEEQKGHIIARNTS